MRGLAPSRPPGLQGGEQSAAWQPDAARDVGAHDVSGEVSGREQPVDELRDGAQGLGGRDIGPPVTRAATKPMMTASGHAMNAGPQRDLEQVAHQDDDDRAKSATNPARNHQLGHSTRRWARHSGLLAGQRGSQSPRTSGRYCANPAAKRGQTRANEHRRALATPAHARWPLAVPAMTPCSSSSGARNAYVSTPPSSSDHAVRKAHQRPAPSRTTSDLSASVHSAAGLPAISIGSGILSGRFQGNPIRLGVAQPGQQRRCERPEPEGAACKLPSLPFLPVYVPSASSPVDGAQRLGVPCRSKGQAFRVDELSLDRIAVNTPSAAIAPNQKIIGKGSGRTVVTMSSAPKAPCSRHRS